MFDSDMSKLWRPSPAPDASPYHSTRELEQFEHILWATDRVEPNHFLLLTRVPAVVQSLVDIGARPAAASARDNHA